MNVFHIPMLLLFIMVNASAPSGAQPEPKSPGDFLSVPSEADSICTIPVNIDKSYAYCNQGLQTGDCIPDFTVYAVNDRPVRISDVMRDGKPLLLIGGSFSCPVFRSKLQNINELADKYGRRIHIFMIYTAEAHPASPDVSPYSGKEWTTDENVNSKIRCPQARTYGDRKRTAKEMMSELRIAVPVLLDSPCNIWWKTFGMAPNSAFLIKPGGIIVEKQGWLNAGRAPMEYYMDSLLNELDGKVSSLPSNELHVKEIGGRVFFELEKEVSPASFSLYDKFGWREVNDTFSGDVYDITRTTGFLGTTYSLDKNELKQGQHTYYVKVNGESYFGQFTVAKRRPEAGDGNCY